jgi:hypothetical protein
MIMVIISTDWFRFLVGVFYMTTCTVCSTNALELARPLSANAVSISPGRFVTLSTSLHITPGSRTCGMVSHRVYARARRHLFAVGCAAWWLSLQCKWITLIRSVKTGTDLYSVLFNIVTHRPSAGHSPQHTRGQQYRSSVFCGPRSDRCYATHDTRGQQYRFESHSRHGCLCAFILCLCCSVYR